MDYRNLPPAIIIIVNYFKVRSVPISQLGAGKVVMSACNQAVKNHATVIFYTFSWVKKESLANAKVSVFDWSTPVTDGQTDGRVIEYSALCAYAVAR